MRDVAGMLLNRSDRGIGMIPTACREKERGMWHEIRWQI